MESRWLHLVEMKAVQKKNLVEMKWMQIKTLDSDFRDDIA